MTITRVVEVGQVTTRDLCNIVHGELDPVTGLCKVKTRDGELRIRRVDLPLNEVSVQILHSTLEGEYDVASFIMDKKDFVCQVDEDLEGTTMLCHTTTAPMKYMSISRRAGGKIEIEISDKNTHIQMYHAGVTET